jgi:hypothetical protein
MRANEFLSESAVSDLANELPNLKKHDYDTIDQLMRRISRRYKITGAKLHDLFVSKYGHTPDHWIKKYKDKLGEEETDESLLGFMTKAPSPKDAPKKKLDYDAVRKMAQTSSPLPNIKNSKDIDKDAKVYRRVAESVDNSQNLDQIKEFVQWSIKTLNIQKPYPKISLSRDTEQAQKDHRTGLHTDDGHITVYIENRNLVDIFRTIFHELVHHRQDQLNMIGPDDSYPGSPVEAMADMMAGKYIKIYGKQHPEIFQ